MARKTIRLFCVLSADKRSDVSSRLWKDHSALNGFYSYHCQWRLEEKALTRKRDVGRVLLHIKKKITEVKGLLNGGIIRPIWSILPELNKDKIHSNTIENKMQVLNHTYINQTQNRINLYFGYQLCPNTVTMAMLSYVVLIPHAHLLCVSNPINHQSRFELGKRYSHGSTMAEIKKTLFHPFGYQQSLFVFVSTEHTLSGRECNWIIISWAIDVSKCVLECESVCIRKHKHDFNLRAIVALKRESVC